ncbi:MAG: CorA family divalent cation transporter, partial [Chloroflexota bacterium]
MASLTGPARPRVRLYDADGTDRDIDLDEARPSRLGERHLLWVDVDRAAGQDLEAAAAAFDLERGLAARLAKPRHEPSVTKFEDYLHLALLTMESGEGEEAREADAGTEPWIHTIDVVGGRNWVMTVHDGPTPALDRFDAATHGDTGLGALDAAGLVAAIADEVLTGYLEIVEATEREIDRLDERALRRREADDLLVDIVAVRRRISRIRRSLAPQRASFAALTRPEMGLDDDIGAPWPGLTDRLDRTIDAVENLRTLLLGTFDLQMARAAKDANDVMKVLTLVSAVFLPAVVLAGVMGMNFPLAFFADAENFWLVVAAMIAFAVA